MSFTSKVFETRVVKMADREETIVAGGRHLFPLLPKAFDGIRQIGVIGWSSQGPAQAQNLRESLEGTGIRVKVGLRDKLFMATKVWTSGRAAGIAQMEESARKLRGRVDLMQVHNLVDADAHLETLRRWKAEKRIRYIGVTHYTASAYGQLERYLEKPGIDFVQLNYSLAEREAEQRLLPLARERGIAVLVNRPFGAGSLFREARGKALPSFARDLGATSWAELFLKFVVAHPAVTCAIPATSKTEHLRQNMNAGRTPLPDEPMRKKIASALLE